MHRRIARVLANLGCKEDQVAPDKPMLLQSVDENADEQNDYNYMSVCFVYFNPFTPKILSVILLTVCQIVLVMLV